MHAFFMRRDFQLYSHPAVTFIMNNFLDCVNSSLLTMLELSTSFSSLVLTFFRLDAIENEAKLTYDISFVMLSYLIQTLNHLIVRKVRVILLLTLPSLTVAELAKSRSLSDARLC